MDEELARRARVYSVPKKSIMQLLNWRQNCVLKLPQIADVPEGSVVDDCIYDWNRDCFLMRVHHASFDAVAPGGAYPEAEFTTMQFTVPPSVFK